LFFFLSATLDFCTFFILTFLPALYAAAVLFISAARFFAASGESPAKYFAGTP
jgi:hypothetical protein